MPYFKWRGINLSGSICNGILFVESTKEIAEALESRKIALLDAHETTPLSSYYPITSSQIIAFFEQLKTLITAEILLPEALSIMNNTQKDLHMQQVVYELWARVSKGTPLSVAMNHTCFDKISVQLVQAGEESGKLSAALEALCDYLVQQQSFKKALISALAMPLITLLFFAGISLAIVFFICPRFALFFQQTNQQLPASTKFLIAIGEHANASSTWFFLLIGTFIIGAFFVFFLSNACKFIRDVVLINLPFFGPCIRFRALATFFQSVALLLESGSKVVPALKNVTNSISNTVLAHKFLQFTQKVSDGFSISDSMAQFPQVFDQEVIAMVHVGQESGKLGEMFFHIARYYQQALTRRLAIITALAQPLIMIVLGLLISGLVMAIYTPLCTLGNFSL